jgi:aminopeptidase YwaD
VRVAASLLAALWMICGVAGAFAQNPPLLSGHDVAVLANELSGETAKRNLEGIARFHRQRGSAGFHAAAELVAERLRAYGLNDVAILQFPADGKIFYGTQRSRPAWDAEVGELEAYAPLGPAPCGNTGRSEVIADCVGGPRMLHVSYDAEPVVLAEDSENTDMIATLADVGAGTKESDYEGKEVKGRIVLVSASPGAVQDLAVGKFGAVGIVSYAQNQKTAWSGENQDAIRWGHLGTFSAHQTFAFMVSLKTARELQEHIKVGGVLVHAVVKAGQHAGNYEVVTATIPGANAKLKEEEIAFSCHLDHQRPGANDNASGCVTILEVARTLQKLIGEGKLARPARTIRFIFPPEVEGTMALLNARPEFAARIKAVIHMDMVGGGPESKAVFHVTRGPMSLPSFVHDVAWAFAEWVNEESYKFAATGSADFPMVAPEGGKEPLRAEYSPFSMGSDHEVYQDSSFGIPAIYLNDWPDRYIHTNFDTAANIDTTKLKRAGFIGAASGYFLAGMTENGSADALRYVEAFRMRRGEETELRARQTSDSEAQNLKWQYLNDELEIANSIKRIVPSSIMVSEIAFAGSIPLKLSAGYKKPVSPNTAEASWKFRRRAEPKGPLTVFGYDYFSDKAQTEGVATPKLLSYEGLWGAGDEYAYEILNFTDGRKPAQEICDAVSAEYGPVPIEMVVEYLKALEKIGVVEEAK